MEAILPTVIICITSIVALILILKTVERVVERIHKEPEPPVVQEIPDIKPLQRELDEIKTKMGSLQVAAGFRKLK